MSLIVLIEIVLHCVRPRENYLTQLEIDHGVDEPSRTGPASAGSRLWPDYFRITFLDPLHSLNVSPKSIDPRAIRSQCFFYFSARMLRSMACLASQQFPCLPLCHVLRRDLNVNGARGWGGLVLELLWKWNLC